jgi:hypothetical protein
VKEVLARNVTLNLYENESMQAQPIAQRCSVSVRAETVEATWTPVLKLDLMRKGMSN